MRDEPCVRRLRTVLLCAALMTVGCGAEPDESADDDRKGETRASSVSLERGRGTTTLPSSTPLPLLDGERDAQFLRCPAQSVAHVLRGDTPVAADLSATWRALFDGVYFYLFVEVTDDRVVVDSTADIPWEDDSVEIFLDSDGSAEAQYDGVDDVHLIFRPDDPQVHLGLNSAPVKTAEVGVVSKRTETGYQLEIDIPWRAVGDTRRFGWPIGMDVHVNDDDGANRDRKLAWHAWQDESWQSPSLFAPVLLVAYNPALTYFEGLGDLPGGGTGSVVTDLTPAGDVVVGYSEGPGGSEAFRWWPERGLVGLGGAPSRADAVSPNGGLIVGQSSAPQAPANTGVLWRGPGSFEPLFGGPVLGPGQPPLLSIWEPLVVFDDGRVFGRCVQGGGGPVSLNLGCRWDRPYEVALLTPASAIYAADTSGNLGGVRLPYREPIGSAAMLNGVELGYPTNIGCMVPHACRAEVRDFSVGAEVVVGTSFSPFPVPPPQPGPPHDQLEEAAFLYTSSEGMVRLSDLPGGVRASGAYAINRDGRVIAGYGTDGAGLQATVWHQREPVRLADLILAYGGRIPKGWRLQEVRSVSADGRIFAGNGRNAEGNPEGFRVTLPWSP